MSKSAIKLFDALMPIDNDIYAKWHNAPFHADRLKDHDEGRMREMYADAVIRFRAAGIRPSDVSQGLLNMLENENYHQLYAMLEIYSGRKTLDDDIREWLTFLKKIHQYYHR